MFKVTSIFGSILHRFSNSENKSNFDNREMEY